MAHRVPGPGSVNPVTNENRVFGGRFRAERRLKEDRGIATLAGTDLERGGDVIIKTAAAQTVSPGMQMRLEHESEVLRSVSGPHLTSLIEVGREELIPVMDLTADVPFVFAVCVNAEYRRQRGDCSMTAIDPSHRHRPVVLIADNEPDIVELVRFELEREGYDVLRAANGQQALDLAREHEPDLVLVDVHMPKLDGYQVTREIRADERLNPVPVMILSGSVLESDVAQSFEAGANRHMGKPFSPVALRNEVQALLGR